MKGVKTQWGGPDLDRLTAMHVLELCRLHGPSLRRIERDSKEKGLLVGS